jgi:RNA polymerase sigma factor (sigma-70 family)
MRATRHPSVLAADGVSQAFRAANEPPLASLEDWKGAHPPGCATRGRDPSRERTGYLASERSWELVVKRFDGLTRRAARSCGLRGADVDDVVQATWLRLFESIEQVRSPAALPGWLATTTRRGAMSVQQRYKREARAVVGTSGRHAVLSLTDREQTHEESDPLQAALAAERSRTLRAVLASLPPAARLLLSSLIADSEPTYREISRSLNVPVGSIGPTRRRLLDRLSQHPALRAVA